jgi:phosphonate C-P lyase system protein PhnH
MTAPPAIAGHDCFRAVLSALAHPGRPFAPDGASDATGRLAALVGALYEPDTPIWWDAPWELPWPPRRVSIEQAQVLLVHGAASGGALTRAPRGSEEHPSHGATVVYASSQPIAVEVQLRGPGVDGALGTSLALTTAELSDRATACARRPLGIDLLLIDAEGWIIGLPRSTRVEVIG